MKQDFIRIANTYFDRDYASTLKWALDVAKASQVNPAAEIRAEMDAVLYAVEEIRKKMDAPVVVEERVLRTAAGPRKF